jgi:hypothetical protein
VNSRSPCAAWGFFAQQFSPAQRLTKQAERKIAASTKGIESINVDKLMAEDLAKKKAAQFRQRHRRRYLSTIFFPSCPWLLTLARGFFWLDASQAPIHRMLRPIDLSQIFWIFDQVHDESR